MRDIYIFWGIRIVAVLAVAIFAWLYINKLPQPAGVSDLLASVIFPNGSRVNVEVASTKQAQSQGLSGRTSLPPNQGMFFIFPEESTHPFWMPNMNFNIDIIWLNSSYHVTEIKKDVKPLLSGIGVPELFINTQPAKYVLEVNAGVVDQNQLHVGDILKYSAN